MTVENTSTAEFKCFKGSTVPNFMEGNFPVYYDPNVKWPTLHKMANYILIVNHSYYWIVLGRIENSGLLALYMVGRKINSQSWSLLQWFILDFFFKCAEFFHSGKLFSESAAKSLDLWGMWLCCNISHCGVGYWPLQTVLTLAGNKPWPKSFFARSIFCLQQSTVGSPVLKNIYIYIKSIKRVWLESK